MSAERAYADALLVATAQARLLALAIAAHAEKAALTPDSWGHTGDMKYVISHLSDVLLFLGVPATSETSQ